jgi:hypothetical protein
MAIRTRTPFAPEFNFVIKRPMTYNGRQYEPGDEFDKSNIGERVLQRLYEARYIDAVIPSLMLKQDRAEPEAEAQPEATPEPAPEPKAAAVPAAKPKGKRKADAVAPEPQPELKPEAQAPRYRLDDGFGFYRIYDGETVVYESTSADEAKAAMAKLSGE